jgi:hypothetical protein
MRLMRDAALRTGQRTGVLGAFLGSPVVFLSVLLIGKKERDMDSEREASVLMGYLALVAVQEGDSSHVDGLGPAGLGSCGVLA